jgi:hypothetical protein
VLTWREGAISLQLLLAPAISVSQFNSQYSQDQLNLITNNHDINS